VVLVPSGTQAAVLLLALTGRIALYVSPPVLAEYEEVLRRPRLKLQPRQIDAAMAAIRKVAHLVQPTHAVSVSPHESDNRFLECAEAAEAWRESGIGHWMTDITTTAFAKAINMDTMRSVRNVQASDFLQGSRFLDSVRRHGWVTAARRSYLTDMRLRWSGFSA
jgi:hypothetical protein